MNEKIGAEDWRVVLFPFIGPFLTRDRRYSGIKSLFSCHSQSSPEQ